MDNKSNFNSLLNHFKNSATKLDNTKSYTIFFVIIIFIIVILLIIIVRRHFNQTKIMSREIRNTFFLEMLDHKSPYNAWNDNNKICISGKKSKKLTIPGNKLGPKIGNTYTLMFWVKIKTVNFIKDVEPNSKYPLIALSDNNKFNKECSDDGNQMFPGFFIKPINNTLTVKMSDSGGVCNESEVYNFPYDTWTCISTYVTKDYIEIYIDGKLLKTSEFNTLTISPENLDMYIGKYPGLLAFLSININPLFGSDGIYKEYLYYKNIIDIYEQSKYKEIYNHDRQQNPDNYKNVKNGLIKKTKPDPNICN